MYISGLPGPREECIRRLTLACVPPSSDADVPPQPSDLSPDEPSFNAGFVAEGGAGVCRVAPRLNEKQRANRYANCWRKAAGCVQTLVLEGTDVFPFHEPGKALVANPSKLHLHGAD